MKTKPRYGNNSWPKIGERRKPPNFELTDFDILCWANLV